MVVRRRGHHDSSTSRALRQLDGAGQHQLGGAVQLDGVRQLNGAGQLDDVWCCSSTPTELLSMDLPLRIVMAC
jgi:hypothetical protein